MSATRTVTLTRDLRVTEDVVLDAGQEVTVTVAPSGQDWEVAAKGTTYVVNAPAVFTATAPARPRIARAHLVTEDADRAVYGGPEVIVFEHWTGVGPGVELDRSSYASCDEPADVLYELGWRMVPGANVVEPAPGYLMVDVEAIG